eukprot:scaffold168_cov124-Cylindrotheca_fusiformis.AAC.3
MPTARKLQTHHHGHNATMKLFSVLLLLTVATAAAYSPRAPSSRRDVFKSVFATGVASFVYSGPANAIDACPKGSKNCIRTTWTPPSGSSKASSIASLRKVLEAYPQEGQDKVDLGGWTLVEDNFNSGSARFEYKSGIGNFAKFFNGGKPFIDDLKLEISDSGVVEVRSSSRVGESDLGVNQKRLAYIGKGLAAEGWTVPEPTY